MVRPLGTRADMGSHRGGTEPRGGEMLKVGEDSGKMCGSGALARKEGAAPRTAWPVVRPLDTRADMGSHRGGTEPRGGEMLEAGEGSGKLCGSEALAREGGRQLPHNPPFGPFQKS